MKFSKKRLRNDARWSSCFSVPGGLRSQRGVALVLTLIMLAIITVVTVVFLATARRNRSSTTVSIDQTVSESAAEVAYQHATARVVERILRDRNPLSYEFLVSYPVSSVLVTNGGAVYHPPTYSYQTNNGYVRPVGPDTIPVVLNASNTVDVYLDFNRNRLFDDPGNDFTRPFGDAIWMGNLDRPWLPHSRSNRFVSRMAYLVQPVGKTLDANTIHNDTSPNGGEEFLRNQGFGPWELNLAAFLHEFNPTLWDYSYTDNALTDRRPVALGAAFGDARSFLNYRHGWPLSAGNVLDAMSFGEVYPGAIANNFPMGQVDVYSDGLVRAGFPGQVLGPDISIIDQSSPLADSPLKGSRWAGADTTNQFFHHQEFFDHADPAGQGGRSNKVTYEFYQRLTNTIGGTNGTLYYKLLSQLGTDSDSDVEERINLNFADQNATFTNLYATNFVPWDASDNLALAFFTNVAQRIFLAQSNEFNQSPGTNLGIRSMFEIPIAPTNLYSSAIHRILQVAANIFDSTRSNIYPSVFRPLFGSKPGDQTTYIVGYVKDERLSTLDAWLRNNTNGIPMVIGAKKGFPNFNEFTLRSEILASRKLQVTRPRTTAGTIPDGTNQMYVLGISNYFCAESWNSFNAIYPRPLSIIVSNLAVASLTNSLGFQTNQALTMAGGGPITTWRGFSLTAINSTNSFRMMLNTNQVFLSNAVYQFSDNTFKNVSTNDYENYPNFPLPDWVLTISNRLAYWMFEPGLDRIIDFVLLADTHVVDLHRDLIAARDPYLNTGTGTPAVRDLWNTNRASATSPTDGILRQLEISTDETFVPQSEWRSFGLATQPNEDDKRAAVGAFRHFLGLPPLAGYPPFETNYSRAMQAPFNPAVKLAAATTWQANDPFVHYHPEDLRIGFPTNHQFLRPDQPATNLAPSTLGYLNTRYSPWHGNPNSGNYPESGDAGIKDAGVNSSPDWRFPSNKLASVGLLGRVHRGTPWQTIYLKPDIAPSSEWSKQSADSVFVPGRGYVSRTHPTNDWLLADMFTTAMDERSSRGLVSINQTNMETWSALLSGIVVLSNNLEFPQLGEPRTYDDLLVQPSGGLTNGFFQIWTNIYKYQTNKFARGQSLVRVGELIQHVPELTTRSPFINLSDPVQLKHGLDDFAFEQIPQQILPLLRVGHSRFIIYAYGQALRPERIDPGTGVAVNYQVTSEFATRTVIRIEGDPFSRVRAVVESFNVLPPD